MGFQEYIAFTILVPCILSMWPTEPAQSLCSDKIYYVLTFYYFIQLLISFYAPYTVFIVWAECFLKIFLSNTNSLLIMVSFNIHAQSCRLEIQILYVHTYKINISTNSVL
jgi:hypothetical protein